MVEKYIEIAGVAVGLVYIYLEYRASIWLWVAGIVMPALYIYIYYAAGLYADMGINVYYLLASFYGIAVWLGWGSRFLAKRERNKNSSPIESTETAQKEKSPQVLPISHMPSRYYPPAVAICLLFFVVIAWILVNFTDSVVPYMDSLTTAMSVVALWMLAHKYVEQWFAWILVNAISCGLYFYVGINYTALLYGLYVIIAIFGYFKWLKLMEEQNGEKKSEVDTQS